MILISSTGVSDVSDVRANTHPYSHAHDNHTNTCCIFFVNCCSNTLLVFIHTLSISSCIFHRVVTKSSTFSTDFCTKQRPWCSHYTDTPTSSPHPCPACSLPRTRFDHFYSLKKLPSLPCSLSLPRARVCTLSISLDF